MSETPDAGPAIRTQDLRKQYGAVRALDGLTLSVAPGTVFGFLGPNGAGKTTTLRILTGLARASGGQAWVAGAAVGKQQGRVARRTGYLPEEPAFYPWMTPREYLDQAGRAFRMPGRERALRVEELLGLVGLVDAAKRRIGGFSRGMRQRLGLAQALMNRPEVLLLDEPVSALDPAGRKEVLELIGQLRGRCTVFMSTHILADVERICDSVGILSHGKLVTEAPRDELVARYAVPVVEVELEAGAVQEQLQSWARGLGDQPWLKDVTVLGADAGWHGPVARVLVNDPAAARDRLLASVAAAGLPVTRFEMVRPSLEEVFLRLVGEGGATA